MLDPLKPFNMHEFPTWCPSTAKGSLLKHQWLPGFAFHRQCAHRIVPCLQQGQRRQAQLLLFFVRSQTTTNNNAPANAKPQTKLPTFLLLPIRHKSLEQAQSQSSARPHEPTRRSCQKGGRNPAQELCPNRRPLTVSVRPFGPRLETAERPPNCSPI